jgi:hypothetical protein
MAKSQATKSQELAVQEKKALVSKEESTVPARYYVQNTDIYETDDALTVVAAYACASGDTICCGDGRSDMIEQRKNMNRFG